MKNMNKKIVIMGAVLAAAAAGAALYAVSAPVVVGTTLENLKVAYIGEINTKARYVAFAAKADEEGYAGAASLFRAVSHSEQIHADNHARAIKELGAAAVGDVEKPVVKSTRENLAWVVKAENREYNSLYPAYVSRAVKENYPGAVISLRGAMASEGGHARLFGGAAENLQNWKVKRSFSVCRSCGYTTDDPKMVMCPFDTKPSETFKTYD